MYIKYWLDTVKEKQRKASKKGIKKRYQDLSEGQKNKKHQDARE